MGRWTKQHFAELDAAWDGGLITNTTSHTEAFDMADIFRTVAINTFKKYYYDWRKKKEAEQGNKVPSSEYSVFMTGCLSIVCTGAHILLKAS